MALVDHFELLQTVMAHIESKRWKDDPMNQEAYYWKMGYEEGLNVALNEVRREL